MIWYNINQSADEEQWLDLRICKVGGSSIGKVMANYGKAFGSPAHDLALTIALEKITGIRSENTYTNSHMDRGHEQEPIARMLYEQTTFSVVANGGYFSNSNYEGTSPDGLVYENGVIEIKCVIKSVHFATIKRNAFDPKYKWQLIYNLKNSKKEWIDYVEYCSDFPTGKQLFIQKLFKKDLRKEYRMINKRMSEFKKLIRNKIHVINSIM